MVNYRSQGAYDVLGQPTIAKYAIVRQMLFLKKWTPQHAKTEWGSSTIHFASGKKTIGGNRAFLRFLQESMYETGMFWNGYKNLTRSEQQALNQFLRGATTFVLSANLTAFLSLQMNCEDDGEADWKDYLCLFMKKFTNEVEGIFSMWGINEMLYTYGKEEANGIGIWEKFGWSIFGPASVFRKFFDFDSDIYSTDPYYKFRQNSTQIDWDKTHPLQAGKPGLAVAGLDLIGIKGITLGLDPKSIEFQNRAYNEYMPKTYTKELRTRYTKNHEGLEVKPRGSEQDKAKQAFKQALKKINQEINSYETAGRPVPTSTYEKLDKLEQQYREELQRIETGEDGGYNPFLLKPYWRDRPGMDLAPKFDVE